jgi:hypothetical protein
MFYGLRHPKSVESEVLKLLTNFCDHRLLEVTLSPLGCFVMWTRTIPLGVTIWTTSRS